MWQVFTALIGLGTSVNTGAQNQLLSQQAANESRLNYSRSKILGVYNQDAQQLLLFGGLALLLVIIIAIKMIKK